MPVAEYWPQATAALTTVFLAVAMQSHWSSRTRRLVALGFSVAVASVGLYLQGGIDTNDAFSTLFAVVVGSQGLYALLCKQLDKLSTATDVTDPPPPPPNPGLGGVKILKTNGTYIVPADKQGS